MTKLQYEELEVSLTAGMRRLEAWLPPSHGSAPLRFRDGTGYVSASRDASGAWTLTVIMPEENGLAPYRKEETYATTEEAYGALAAIGPWDEA